MSPRFLIVFVALGTKFFYVEALPKPISNITVIGAVFCDVCSNNTFSKHSYFIKGAEVLIQCKFRANSMSTEEISIMAERTTDRFGVYKLDIPPVDGLECREGREVKSSCRASLIKSSSSVCGVPGLRRSTEHVAIKSRDADICFFNLNALNFRPANMDTLMCRTDKEPMSRALNSSLFFWPSWPLFGLPWPIYHLFLFPSLP
ncbi:uncharacterized protein LOC103717468 [Phoenix dactylifera]|uniref:Uncharacterized protein LOC103717468 n=1 Tax=Phoenix dactylifera TaxID=42345 RepID=A0A8B7CQC0_PHODC|nr:uncharacterized protein LOC103717468 [Phoenix dactylifera]